ncbi:MAG: ferritin-like domain-containing protein [Saprospiraceae bacterium]|nr:ferritin-like domain-containing protein [Saprospiraceae bacterium]
MASPKSKSPAKSTATKKSTTNHSNSSNGSNGSNGSLSTKTNNTGMKSSQLMKLFEDGLKDIYWAEKALTTAIPKMIKNATSPELVKALTNHLEETKGQVTRIEEVFQSFGKKASAKKCDAMEGLIKEAEGIMEECEEGAMRDAGIIAAGQKVEHYEIASYGTLRQFAQTLGLAEAAMLLGETLGEEKAADDKLTEVAVKAVNVRASSKGVEEEE